MILRIVNIKRVSMKVLVLSFGVFLLLVCAHSDYTPIAESNSCTKQYDSKLKMNIYSYVDQFSEFPGGIDSLLKYTSKNRPLTNGGHIQGTIRFEIVIGVDGAVLDEKIPGKKISDYAAVDKQLIRKLRIMAKWKPGECKNQKVPFRYPFLIHTSPSS